MFAPKTISNEMLSLKGQKEFLALRNFRRIINFGTHTSLLRHRDIVTLTTQFSSLVVAKPFPDLYCIPRGIILISSQGHRE